VTSVDCESSIATPATTYGGEYLHPSMPAMAAAFLFHICQNHPFVDGNKRTAANAAVTFLLTNDWEPLWTEPELVDSVLGGRFKPTQEACLVSLGARVIKKGAGSFRLPPPIRFEDLV